MISWWSWRISIWWPYHSLPKKEKEKERKKEKKKKESKIKAKRKVKRKVKQGKNNGQKKGKNEGKKKKERKKINSLLLNGNWKGATTNEKLSKLSITSIPPL